MEMTMKYKQLAMMVGVVRLVQGKINASKLVVNLLRIKNTFNFYYIDDVSLFFFFGGSTMEANE